MQTQSFSLSAWRGALCLALIVFLSALGALAAAPSPSAERASAAIPLTAAEMTPPLLQFTAGGHVIGFTPTQVILAAFDHALRIEFVGTTGVTPMAAGAEATAADDMPKMGRTQPLGVVTYFDLWPGIRVEYRPSEGGIVKSTYTVAPGADAGQIRLRYNLPVALQSDGSLQIRFARGVISESAPIAWQEIDGERVPVPVAFSLLAGGEVAFRLGAYDPHYPLTIDPNYVWHTFYGSADGDDRGFGIAVDGSGNVYITGESQETWQGDNKDPLHPHSGNYDIVVVKLNSAGEYQWHTFYGSDIGDQGNSIALDGSGNLYITGESWDTWQGDGDIDPIHAHSRGTNRDIFVMKLSSEGAYQWHTFYGSDFGDYGNSIAVDGSGNVHITGKSYATWLGDNKTDPLHPHSGNYDIVVLKLNSAGKYQWHTFYGSTKWDGSNGIAVDGSGNVYIAGSSAGTWQGPNGEPPKRSHSGDSDIVVVKLNSTGAYQWHTFYGSNDGDGGLDIALDSSGNLYITGYSFATWQGPNGKPPKHSHSGDSDIVVVKLNSAGEYQWHTFYGSEYEGEHEDCGSGIVVDGGGNIYITGTSVHTWQGDGGASPRHPHSGDDEIVALKLNSAGGYQWHTFYGSNDWDGGLDIALDSSGNLYITGYSYATWQGDKNADPLHPYSGGDNSDIVVLKLYPKFIYLPLIVKGN